MMNVAVVWRGVGFDRGHILSLKVKPLQLVHPKIELVGFQTRHLETSTRRNYLVNTDAVIRWNGM